jgi:hypothetical protein
MKMIRILGMMLCLLAVSGNIYPLQLADGGNIYAIKDVNVIPMDRNVVLNHQTVIIDAGKIKDFGSENKVHIPKNAQIINGQGKYLMPGLTDTHSHFFYEQGVDPKYIPQELKVMLANGITTVRIMNGCKLYQDAKNQIAGRKIIGPELFMASPQFVGAWPWKNDTVSPKQIVTNAREAEEAVRRYKREGYDEIKITFFMRRPAYDAIIKTAAEEHIKVTGHIGHDVKLPAALAAGQQIEHLDEFMEMLLPDTSPIKYSVSGTDIWNKRAWQTVPYLDENKIPALIKMVKDAGVYLSPTNYFFKVNFGLGQTDEEIKNSPDYQFIPAKLLPERADNRDYYWNQLKIDEQKRLRWYGLRKKIIKGLNDAGVKLMSGSDAPEWYMVQGFSVHNEVANMVECGLSNFDALKTSTVNPCTYLGIIDRKGTIATGKDADLLLLDKNPLEDISNTKTINGVLRYGQYYSRKDLDEMLQQVLEVKAKL